MRISARKNNVYPISRRSRGLAAMGFDPSSLLPLATKLIGGGGDGGGAPMADPNAPGGAGPITVSPAIQTTISPQISPIFQQSYMPSGSPMTAGTTQTAPVSHSASTGQPGGASIPGDVDFPSAGGVPASYPADEYGTPVGGESYAASYRGFNWKPWAIGGAALLGILFFMQQQKKRAA
jgi:hypothetical protein